MQFDKLIGFIQDPRTQTNLRSLYKIVGTALVARGATDGGTVELVGGLMSLGYGLSLSWLEACGKAKADK